jgi:glutathione synthase/RimK-type ligase-like ATP-grasp enzyme
VSLLTIDCCILNSGKGAWAFDPLASRLASFLDIDISEHPRRFNYLLHAENEESLVNCGAFIPLESIRAASDKRLLTSLFQKHDVPTPQTSLCQTFGEALSIVREGRDKAWCLKFPTSCGGNGHRMLEETSIEPRNWPQPFIVQEFIKLRSPEVYRTYCAGGELFGWVARRFPANTQNSIWVAHARGARYVALDQIPPEASSASKCALQATGLWDSFGCADLLCKPSGEWLVLEVGTDGLFNHVDRDIGDPRLEDEMFRRITDAFWKKAEVQ